MNRATPAILRLDTGRQLHHRVFATAEDADAWSGFEIDDGGLETVQCGWTQPQVDALDLAVPGPDWVRGFRHELVLHLAGGGTLPYETAMTGFGTATLVSPGGHLLTVHHLVTGPQRHHRIPEKTFVPDGFPAPHLRVLTDARVDLGAVRVCYIDSALDLAVLKIEPAQGMAPIDLPQSPPDLHERIWQMAYPHRTHRSEHERRFLGYQDADHSLRYCPGLVVAGVGEAEWFSDAEAVLGSSGSALVNDTGQLVGVYRGGGAGDLFPDDPFKYRKAIDVHTLRQDLPSAFGAVEA